VKRIYMITLNLWNLGSKFFHFVLILVWMVGLLKWIGNSIKLNYQSWIKYIYNKCDLK
jgi:hypothetical protein